MVAHIPGISMRSLSLHLSEDGLMSLIMISLNMMSLIMNSRSMECRYPVHAIE